MSQAPAAAARISINTPLTTSLRTGLEMVIVIDGDVSPRRAFTKWPALAKRAFGRGSIARETADWADGPRSGAKLSNDGAGAADSILSAMEGRVPVSILKATRPKA